MKSFAFALLRGFAAFAVLISAPAAALSLNNADVYQLDNGLTVILLEDRNFPVASVQMLYRVGARNENVGKTGLAHFLEHMAFRASKNFPDTEVVSRIYAQGGEWHGYTWTDQTTYFATVPKDGLQMLLQIEADRLDRLVIDPDFIEAERGAVLAEMHMYENDPSSMLNDALIYTSFLAHPYRNNTIGWESDIDSVTHADVLQFYEQHYHPANAVLAVVGDFDADDVKAEIQSLFGAFERRAATPLPHTIEPMQSGARRVTVSGSAPGRLFAMGYRAPSATSADFAAFLVLQEVLSGGSGVSFLQNDWGTDAKAGSLLADVDADISTWFPPSADNYMFVVSGRADDETPAAELESAVEQKIAILRNGALDGSRVESAIEAVLDELVFDVQTTEDAAHQLAYFAGMDALDSLLTLPQALRLVSADDLQRVARDYLIPERRTVAWYLPGPLSGLVSSTASVSPHYELPAREAADETRASAPVQRLLRGGVPVLFMSSDIASSVDLKVVVPGTQLSSSEFAANAPEPGFLTWSGRSRPAGLRALAERASAALREARHSDASSSQLSADPGTRLRQEFGRLRAPLPPTAGEKVSPVIITVTGDLDVDGAVSILDDVFGDFSTAPRVEFPSHDIPAGRRAVELGVAVAQSQLGYIVAAPAADESDYLAYRCLLHILAHGYEGRLGKEAISKKGLAYYIDAAYLSAGGRGWATLSIGVDTDKMAELESLLASEITKLRDEPPSKQEIDEAKQYLLGRAVSAAQSNDELTTQLARHWLLHEQLPSVGNLRARLELLTRADVLRVIPMFSNGLTVAVIP